MWSRQGVVVGDLKVKSVEDRVILVTGAASGIGAAIASRFLRQGSRVASFDLAGSDETSKLERSLSLRGDAASEADIRQAIERTVEEFGRLDVLVNNVGIETNGTAVEQSAAEWDRHFDVNLRSAFLFSKYAIPLIELQGSGSIVNIASVHSFVSWPRCVAYDATKAGLLGLTRALALDHGRKGIRVNAVAPGYIKTPLLDRWFSSGAATEQDVLAFHPLGRIGSPADVAEAVAFLVSDQASFITGICLTVDGGLTAAGR